MLGMDQVQRSNAVGANTSYLPSGDTGRDGGGTYTGQATEPTLQDYENFFGPSARDIKTDLQRFKRHGRWHLPDVLQGPNPWLTDRIDGLITDATNSPFTTKILPYRYKEDVDGKIKWNVWSFDEGMASRVPYESAARTLTQSKRSFAGYMVRQGMAIVLEHNFMMTPKGRENFKNQLNQLIGSIQYTNDLDVHMALILAPSYQKTMRERYYSTDKSAAQLCREYADLFGMMQKNVNALDILIEEGKAILRTWGGPMPDFLLCNSKLTFQMTMTPEKTNYITQGIDGVKRLRQGPDLGTYRNLSIVHTRSFAMETGQHPRDVLRRRVRTAEYYRITPHPRNIDREFEFYNEERDNWFTLSFHDLLRCARYHGGAGNASKIDVVYHELASSAVGEERRPRFQAMLGAYAETEADPAALNQLKTGITQNLAANAVNYPLIGKYFVTRVDIRRGSEYQWMFPGSFNTMGVRYIEPVDNGLWEWFQRLNPPADCKYGLNVGPLKKDTLDNFFSACKRFPLNDPFRDGRAVAPMTGEWYTAYHFYLECIKRKGYPLNGLESYDPFATFVLNPAVPVDAAQAFQLFERAAQATEPKLSGQILGLYSGVGCANHPIHMLDGRPSYGAPAIVMPSNGARMASRMFITREMLDVFLSKWTQNGVTFLGIDALRRECLQAPANFLPILAQLLVLYNGAAPSSLNFTISLKAIFEMFVALLQTQGYTMQTAVTGEDLARMGISTIPMFVTTLSHVCFDDSHSAGSSNDLRVLAAKHDGQLSFDLLEALSTRGAARANHPFTDDFNQLPAIPALIAPDAEGFFTTLKNRLFKDPMEPPVMATVMAAAALVPAGGGAPINIVPALMGSSVFEFRRVQAFLNNPFGPTTMSTDALNLVVNLNAYFDDEPLPRANNRIRPEDAERAGDVEIVVVRPNIEHNMLGVIMGLGGNELGNTLWGQTELSVYDDSMHGIWGMSYKYHERAIVFNEKNLIRMWDIAYDGYNGGKDDTYVDWTEENSPNGVGAFKEATLNLGKNYRGPSMMVMAFVHDRTRLGQDNRNVFNQHFRRNWPSPVVFYDTYTAGNPRNAARETLPIDYDNLQTVDVEEFRVFNNELYTGSYKDYRELMPDFRSLHVTRKSAGQSSADAETGADCLAFQGSMRIKDKGVVVQDIQGSGHHGPDYVGVASVRAGKGQKTAGQQPTLHRLI